MNKTKERLFHARDAMIENAKKNVAVILIGIYLIFITIWNTGTLYLVGDINARLAVILLIDGFNTPVVIISSLILTGKWKTAIFDKDSQLKINKLDRALDLANQEIENLKLIQELNHTIGDLSEQLHKQKDEFLKQLGYEREITEYRVQIAARDGKVPDAICRVKDWNETNKTIEIIEKSEDTVNRSTE